MREETISLKRRSMEQKKVTKTKRINKINNKKKIIKKNNN